MLVIFSFRGGQWKMLNLFIAYIDADSDGVLRVGLVMCYQYVYCFSLCAPIYK